MTLWKAGERSCDRSGDQALSTLKAWSWSALGKKSRPLMGFLRGGVWNGSSETGEEIPSTHIPPCSGHPRCSTIGLLRTGPDPTPLYIFQTRPASASFCHSSLLRQDGTGSAFLNPRKAWGYPQTSLLWMSSFLLPSSHKPALKHRCSHVSWALSWEGIPAGRRREAVASAECLSKGRWGQCHRMLGGLSQLRVLSSSAVGSVPRAHLSQWQRKVHFPHSERCPWGWGELM